MTKAREIHLQHLGVKELSPCQHCYLPRKTEHNTISLDDRLIGIDNYVDRDQTIGK